MISFLSYLLLFSIPILLILIVNIKRKQRIIYNHTLLRNFQDTNIKDFLLKYFHLYFDIIFDLLIAIALSFFLSGILSSAGRKNAVCIDGSYSMILSVEGKTPLDRAMGLLYKGQILPEKYDLFILSFNPSIGQAELYPLRGLKKLDNELRAKEMLIQRYTFLNQDLKRLEELFRRGYKRVIFITDSFPYANTNLEVLELGREKGDFFYPVSIKYDFTGKSTELTFYRHAYKSEIGIEVFNREKDAFEPFSASEYQISSDDNHIILSLPEKGLFRVSIQEMDFAFNLHEAVIGTEAVGDYSKLIVEVLPQLEEGREHILLADLEYSPQSSLKELNKKINSYRNYEKKIITLLPTRRAEKSPADYIHPLESSLSHPCLTEYPESLFNLHHNPDTTTIFYQNPSTIKDTYTPIVYLSRLAKEFPPSFTSALKRKSYIKASGMTSYVYEKDGEYLALNLSPGELFDVTAQGDLLFKAEKPKRIPIFILLLLLYSLKMAFLFIFHRGQQVLRPV